MTKERKAVAPATVEIIDPIGGQQTEQAMAVMRETAISEQQEQVSSAFDLGRFVGVAQLARTMSSFSAAAEIRAFEEINKSKAFKNLPIKHPDGSFCPAENIDAFCRAVFGKGYKAMSNHKVMLQQLGEEAYENASRLNLNRSQLRLLLTLPEDERAAVEEAMRDGGKDEVVTLIQSLASKLDESRTEAENLRGELAATEEISAEKTQRIEKLLKEQRRIQAATPDQVLAELHAESTRMANDARGAVIGNLRQAIRAVQQHHETNGGDSTAFLAGLVAQLANDLVELRLEFDLPEINTNEHGWIDSEAA